MHQRTRPSPQAAPRPNTPGARRSTTGGSAAPFSFALRTTTSPDSNSLPTPGTSEPNAGVTVTRSVDATPATTPALPQHSTALYGSQQRRPQSSSHLSSQDSSQRQNSRSVQGQPSVQSFSAMCESYTTWARGVSGQCTPASVYQQFFDQNPTTNPIDQSNSTIRPLSTPPPPFGQPTQSSVNVGPGVAPGAATAVEGPTIPSSANRRNDEMQRRSSGDRRDAAKGDVHAKPAKAAIVSDSGGQQQRPSSAATTGTANNVAIPSILRRPQSSQSDGRSAAARPQFRSDRRGSPSVQLTSPKGATPIQDLSKAAPDASRATSPPRRGGHGQGPKHGHGPSPYFPSKETAEHRLADQTERMQRAAAVQKGVSEKRAKEGRQDIDEGQWPSELPTMHSKVAPKWPLVAPATDAGHHHAISNRHQHRDEMARSPRFDATNNAEGRGGGGAALALTISGAVVSAVSPAVSPREEVLQRPVMSPATRALLESGAPNIPAVRTVGEAGDRFQLTTAKGTTHAAYTAVKGGATGAAGGGGPLPSGGAKQADADGGGGGGDENTAAGVFGVARYHTNSDDDDDGRSYQNESEFGGSIATRSVTTAHSQSQSQSQLLHHRRSSRGGGGDDDESPFRTHRTIPTDDEDRGENNDRDHGGNGKGDGEGNRTGRPHHDHNHDHQLHESESDARGADGATVATEDSRGQEESIPGSGIFGRRGTATNFVAFSDSVSSVSENDSDVDGDNHAQQQSRSDDGHDRRHQDSAKQEDHRNSEHANNDPHPDDSGSARVATPAAAAVGSDDSSQDKRLSFAGVGRRRVSAEFGSGSGSRTFDLHSESDRNKDSLATRSTYDHRRLSGDDGPFLPTVFKSGGHAGHLHHHNQDGVAAVPDQERTDQHHHQGQHRDYRGNQDRLIERLSDGLSDDDSRRRNDDRDLRGTKATTKTAGEKDDVVSPQRSVGATSGGWVGLATSQSTRRSGSMSQSMASRGGPQELLDLSYVGSGMLSSPRPGEELVMSPVHGDANPNNGAESAAAENQPPSGLKRLDAEEIVQQEKQEGHQQAKKEDVAAPTITMDRDEDAMVHVSASQHFRPQSSSQDPSTWPSSSIPLSRLKRDTQGSTTTVRSVIEPLRIELAGTSSDTAAVVTLLSGRNYRSVLTPHNKDAPQAIGRPFGAGAGAGLGSVGSIGSDETQPSVDDHHRRQSGHGGQPGQHPTSPSHTSSAMNAKSLDGHRGQSSGRSRAMTKEEKKAALLEQIKAEAAARRGRLHGTPTAAARAPTPKSPNHLTVPMAPLSSPSPPSSSDPPSALTADSLKQLQQEEKQRRAAQKKATAGSANNASAVSPSRARQSDRDAHHNGEGDSGAGHSHTDQNTGDEGGLDETGGGGGRPRMPSDCSLIVAHRTEIALQKEREDAVEKKIQDRRARRELEAQRRRDAAREKAKLKKTPFNYYAPLPESFSIAALLAAEENCDDDADAALDDDDDDDAVYAARPLAQEAAGSNSRKARKSTLGKKKGSVWADVAKVQAKLDSTASMTVDTNVSKRRRMTKLRHKATTEAAQRGSVFNRPGAVVMPRHGGVAAWWGPAMDRAVGGICSRLLPDKYVEEGEDLEGDGALLCRVVESKNESIRGMSRQVDGTVENPTILAQNDVFVGGDRSFATQGSSHRGQRPASPSGNGGDRAAEKLEKIAEMAESRRGESAALYHTFAAKNASREVLSGAASGRFGISESGLGKTAGHYERLAAAAALKRAHHGPRLTQGSANQRLQHVTSGVTALDQTLQPQSTLGSAAPAQGIDPSDKRPHSAMAGGVNRELFGSSHSAAAVSPSEQFINGQHVPALNAQKTNSTTPSAFSGGGGGAMSSHGTSHAHGSPREGAKNSEGRSPTRLDKSALESKPWKSAGEPSPRALAQMTPRTRRRKEGILSVGELEHIANVPSGKVSRALGTKSTPRYSNGGFLRTLSKEENFKIKVQAMRATSPRRQRRRVTSPADRKRPAKYFTTSSSSFHRQMDGTELDARGRTAEGLTLPEELPSLQRGLQRYSRCNSRQRRVVVEELKANGVVAPSDADVAIAEAAHATKTAREALVYKCDTPPPPPAHPGPGGRLLQIYGPAPAGSPRGGHHRRGSHKTPSGGGDQAGAVARLSSPMPPPTDGNAKAKTGPDGGAASQPPQTPQQRAAQRVRQHSASKRKAASAHLANAQQQAAQGGDGASGTATSSGLGGDDAKGSSAPTTAGGAAGGRPAAAAVSKFRMQLQLAKEQEDPVARLVRETERRVKKAKLLRGISVKGVRLRRFGLPCALSFRLTQESRASVVAAGLKAQRSMAQLERMQLEADPRLRGTDIRCVIVGFVDFNVESRRALATKVDLTTKSALSVESHMEQERRKKMRKRVEASRRVRLAAAQDSTGAAGNAGSDATSPHHAGKALVERLRRGGFGEEEATDPLSAAYSRGNMSPPASAAHLHLNGHEHGRSPGHHHIDGFSPPGVVMTSSVDDAELAAAVARNASDTVVLSKLLGKDLSLGSQPDLGQKAPSNLSRGGANPSMRLRSPKSGGSKSGQASAFGGSVFNTGVDDATSDEDDGSSGMDESAPPQHLHGADAMSYLQRRRSSLLRNPVAFSTLQQKRSDEGRALRPGFEQDAAAKRLVAPSRANATVAAKLATAGKEGLSRNADAHHSLSTSVGMTPAQQSITAIGSAGASTGTGPKSMKPTFVDKTSSGDCVQSRRQRPGSPRPDQGSSSGPQSNDRVDVTGSGGGGGTAGSGGKTAFADRLRTKESQRQKAKFGRDEDDYDHAEAEEEGGLTAKVLSDKIPDFVQYKDLMFAPQFAIMYVIRGPPPPAKTFLSQQNDDKTPIPIREFSTQWSCPIAALKETVEIDGFFTLAALEFPPEVQQERTPLPEALAWVGEGTGAVDVCDVDHPVTVPLFRHCFRFGPGDMAVRQTSEDEK